MRGEGGLQLVDHLNPDNHLSVLLRELKCSDLLVETAPAREGTKGTGQATNLSHKLIDSLLVPSRAGPQSWQIELGLSRESGK